MSSHDHREPNQQTQTAEPKSRPVAGTEKSWCRTVPLGTGISVLAIHVSKQPDISLLKNILHKLQNSHAILRSKLRFNATTKTFSFLTSPSATDVSIETFDLHTTSEIVACDSLNPFHVVLEHELNRNPWSSLLPLSTDSDMEIDLLFASVYTLSDTRWAILLKLHTSACDHTSTVALLEEIVELSESESGGVEREFDYEEEVSLGIEDLVPSGKANKPFWARGIDMIGYGLNAFRLANLDFVDVESPRRSRVVRVQFDRDVTVKLIDCCKSRGIKLFGAIEAAGLLAGRFSKQLPNDQVQQYAVVTLTDCRSTLDPVLNSHHLGFYHSAIMNTHGISGLENLWELANRCYTSVKNAKSKNKHFTDINDMNFLMNKAIDNPGLTPSSSMRTAFISVFEETVIDDISIKPGELGLEDYVSCSSVHGIGPTIAVFDTICNGSLELSCVYPSPLHSREQIQRLIEDMKRILVEGCTSMQD